MEGFASAEVFGFSFFLSFNFTFHHVISSELFAHLSAAPPSDFQVSCLMAATN